MFKKHITIFLFFCCVSISMAQELNCTFSINSDQIGVSNKQVFQTLERALSDFVNKRQWTNKSYKNHEKIECGMTLIINSRNNNTFSGTLQVNAVRPVFGSTYKTPIFNFKDDAISFDYVEFEPLIYNPATFESNLVSLMSYYVYMILAIDADTFQNKGGDVYYEQALDIVNLAQQGNYSGWEAKRNSLNRFSLVDLIMSNAHREYRQVMYRYHRYGMDVFSSEPLGAKVEIKEQLMTFGDLYKRSQNSFLFRIFFDAKSDEVVEVFKSGPKLETKDLRDLLSRVSATNNSKWKKMK
ncbi:type IX secretion system protein PorD [Flavicella marina]